VHDDAVHGLRVRRSGSPGGPLLLRGSAGHGGQPELLFDEAGRGD
jgi:hypothetical protein